MVLKNLVRYIINKYLKEYIEELDYGKVKLDLKNGHVSLEKLHLKPEALTDLSLPVTVATGLIDKLTLVIPWKNLYSIPTKVHIDGFYMLIVPKNEVRRDLTEYYDEKMQRVQRKVDNLRKAASSNKKLDEKDTTFLERMRLQIMQNLEITVENLHISYETISTTKLGHPFSFGITLHHLEMTTTTNRQPIGRTKENSLVIFKMKQINSLSLYWNTQCKSRVDMSFDDVVEDLKCKIATNNYMPNTDEMNYILYPTNLSIDLIMTLQPGEYNFERPAYDVDIHIEKLSLNIDPKQFSDLLDFIKFQNYSKIYDRCREYREFQQTLNTTKLTLEQEERLKYLELKLDVFNLAYIQYSVEMETNPNLITKEVSHQHKHHRHHNYNHYYHHHYHRRHSIKTNRLATSPVTTVNNHKWWNSWWKTTKAHPKEVEHRKSSTSSSTTTDGDFFSDDSPNMNFEIKVKNLALNLSLPKANKNSKMVQSLENETLCPIEIVDARIDFKRRAISSNILFKVDLQSFSLFGMQTDNNHRPSLVMAASASSLPLIHIELELSAVDKKSDYRLFLVLEPLKITYDAPTINKIVECFDPNNDKLSSTLPELKRRTIEEMKQDFNREKIFDMTIQLNGISLILPESGILHKHSNMAHIDLDSLVLKSCLDNDKDDINSVSKEEAQQLRFYTKYKLRLHNLQIIYSQSDSVQLQLLRKMSWLDIHFYKCIYSDDVYLTDWRISIRAVKMTQIELSKAILIQLIHHLKSVPLLSSNMMETLRRINLYFIIFPSYTTFEIDILVEKCYLLLAQYHTSINTDIHCHILKLRDNNNNEKDITISLNNLSMSHQHNSEIKQHSSWLFYQNQCIELNYNNDLSNNL
ncbi:unnamed protein product [Rotaria magnacalcarata]|uniref:Chorein N-terminal domain-containing protein n=2 Tax=Rotaria magnacalcarata TaxID=392030 RepID=A0A819KF47_9BILA|nr:unnamed protein product [Rotaria magnacalcarata]CAF3944916.1 unnamed protein product [Rotaria magnacalcarata]